MHMPDVGAVARCQSLAVSHKGNHRGLCHRIAAYMSCKALTANQCMGWSLCIVSFKRVPLCSKFPSHPYACIPYLIRSTKCQTELNISLYLSSEIPSPRIWLSRGTHCPLIFQAAPKAKRPISGHYSTAFFWQKLYSQSRYLTRLSR